MSLRIISGERRGARIDTPEGLETRPLRDRIRQSLFNILRPHLRGATILDAFAGSGAVGLEALSNGARHAVMVDSSPAAVRVIRANVVKLRFEDRSVIIQGTSPDSPARSPLVREPFDLLFLMPPYHSALCEAVLSDQSLVRRCAREALAVCEVHQDETFAPPDDWRLDDERHYGITRLLFCRRSGTP